MALALHSALDKVRYMLQDYNAEVLQSLTSVNVLENLGSHPGTGFLQDERPRYFAGVMRCCISAAPWPDDRLARSHVSMSANMQRVKQLTEDTALQGTGACCQNSWTARAS